MKIVGQMVCGGKEKYLKRVLEKLKQLVDTTVIAGNNTDPETEKLIKSYGFHFYRDDREWGKQQQFIKTDLLKKVKQLNPDIIIPVDADEVFSDNFTRREAEKYGSLYPACYFYIVNMWGDEEHYRKTMGFWNIRMFQNRIDLPSYYQNTPVHCGLAPVWAYRFGSYVPFYVQHFGLMLKEDRRKKIDRYAKYDPQAKYKDRSYYEALSDETTGTLFDKYELIQKVADEVSRYGNQNKKITMAKEQKFVYVRRLKDNAVLDITLEEWNMIKNSKDRSTEFEFVSEIKTGSKEGEELLEALREEEKPTPEPVSVPEPTTQTGLTEFKCEVCGKVCKNKIGLIGHSRTHKK